MEKSPYTTTLSNSTIIWLLTHNSNKLYNILVSDNYLITQLDSIGYTFVQCPDTKMILYYQVNTCSNNSSKQYIPIPSRLFFIQTARFKLFTNISFDTHHILNFYSKMYYGALSLYKCVEILSHHYYWEMPFPLHICDFLYEFFLKNKTYPIKLDALLTNITNNILIQMNLNPNPNPNPNSPAYLYEFFDYHEQLTNIQHTCKIIHTINTFAFIDRYDPHIPHITMSLENINIVRKNQITDVITCKMIFETLGKFLSDEYRATTISVQKHKYFLIHLIYDTCTIYGTPYFGFDNDLTQYFINTSIKLPTVTSSTFSTSLIPMTCIDYAFQFKSYNFLTNVFDTCVWACPDLNTHSPNEYNYFVKELLDKIIFYDDVPMFKHIVSSNFFHPELIFNTISKYSHNITFCTYILIDFNEKLAMMLMLVNKRYFNSINVLYESVVAIDDLEDGLSQTKTELFSNMFGLAVEAFSKGIQDYCKCIEGEIESRIKCSINELLKSTSKCRTNFPNVIKNHCIELMSDTIPYNNYKIMFEDECIKTHIDKYYLCVDSEFRYVYAIHFDDDIALGNLMVVHAIRDYDVVSGLLYIAIALGSRACFLLLVKLLSKIMDRSHNKSGLGDTIKRTKDHLKRIIVQADLWFHIELFKRYLITSPDIHDLAIIYNDRRALDFIPNMNISIGISLCLKVVKEDRIKLFTELFSRMFIESYHAKISTGMVMSHSPLCWEFIREIMEKRAGCANT